MKDLNTIISKLKVNNSDFVELDLSWQDVGDTNVKVIADALKDNRCLAILKLTSCKLSDDGIIYLAKVLENNSSLVELHLDLNEMSDRGLIALAKMLFVNSSLKTLNIGRFSPGTHRCWRNHLSIEGISVLAEALLNNSSLESINLRSHKLSSTAVAPLFLSLAQNTSLLKLKLGSNLICDEITESLESMLAKNSSLKELYLDDNYISDDGISRIYRSLNCNNTLQVLTMMFSDLDENYEIVNMLEFDIISRIEAQKQLELTVTSKPVDDRKVSFAEQTEELESILKRYDEKAQCEAFTLRSLIPPNEVWRFFIDGILQKEGRGLTKTPFFEQLKSNRFLFSQKNVASYTVKRYIQEIENRPLDDVHSSELMDLLSQHRWGLSEDHLEEYTLGDFYIVDRGWLPFEKCEPGYLQALILAFDVIFSEEKDFVTLLNQLHFTAMSGVSHTNYQFASDSSAGNIRTSPVMTFGIGKETMTLSGIAQLLTNNDRHISILLEYDGFTISISLESIRFFRQNKSRLQEFTSSPNKGLSSEHNQFHQYVTNIENKKKLALILTQVCELSDNVTEIAEFLMSKLNRCSFKIESKLEGNAKERVLEEMNRLNMQYRVSLENSSSSLEKITAIVTIIQSLEQLHPYLDGNCRTICMLFLNHLLIKNGFPLAILDNPNRFDVYSVHELVGEVIQGMKHTFSLIENGMLFDVSTKEILDDLKRSQRSSDVLHFDLLTSIEDKARARLMLRMGRR